MTAESNSPRQADAYADLLALAALAKELGAAGDERALLLEAALAESAMLYRVTEQLNLAANLEQVLRALLLPAPGSDEADITLCAIEQTDDGVPEWLVVSHMLVAGGHDPSAAIGQRYHLPDIPFARLYLSSPNAPLLIDDVEHDPRVDDVARQMYARNGTRATIILALTLQGSWVGLLNLTWQRPIAFGPREQRLYQSLTKQAALLLDNQLKLERLRATLKQTKDQTHLLQSILDHVPVGIALIDGATGKSILGNASLDRMLHQAFTKGSTGAERVTTYRILIPGTEAPLPVSETPTERVRRSGATEVCELDFMLPDGQTRVSVEATGVPVRDELGALQSVLVVFNDVTTRKETARLHLQDEIIRVQAAALAERSSPLIPISDEILVLPLIGSIDVARSQQILDTVLEGSSQRGARFTIIDITGVRNIDTQAAAALTQAAQALRLLGVEPVLTGIRAEVAQALVSLGAHLADLTTLATLQAGIQYVQRRLRKSGLK